MVTLQRKTHNPKVGGSNPSIAFFSRDNATERRFDFLFDLKKKISHWAYFGMSAGRFTERLPLGCDSPHQLE
jgi:hypothetical protein